MPYKEPVLVVDDQLAHRRVASVHLKHHGFDVVEAENVRQAIEAVEAIPELRLAVCDLQIVGGSAREIFHQVGEVLTVRRRGTFVVLTNADLEYPDPGVAPYLEYFLERGVPMLRKPAFWVDDVIPLLQAALQSGGR